MVGRAPTTKFYTQVSRQRLLGANNALKGHVLRGSRSIQVGSRGELLSGGRSGADYQIFQFRKRLTRDHPGEMDPSLRKPLTSALRKPRVEQLTR